jgi:hypothetical protein
LGTTPFQCGYCTLGQICSAAGVIAEGRADCRRDSRVDERQHLPLRRLYEHRGGHPGSNVRPSKGRGDGTMIHFAYTRAAHVREFEIYTDEYESKAHLESPHFHATKKMVKSRKLLDAVPIVRAAQTK